MEKKKNEKKNKKLTKEEKERILLEINLIRNSKDLDAFNYSLFMSLIISLPILIIAIISLAISISLSLSDSPDYSFIFGAILIGLFFILIVIITTYKDQMKPTRKLFQKKHDLFIEKYKKLGIDVDRLKKQLED